MPDDLAFPVQSGCQCVAVSESHKHLLPFPSAVPYHAHVLNLQILKKVMHVSLVHEEGAILDR